MCVKDRHEILWEPVGAAICSPNPVLSPTGQMVDQAIQRIHEFYPVIDVPCYVVMPNHIHMILIIRNDGRQVAAPTISVIVGNLKRAISILLGFSPWQKSFHDHIIRNEDDYRRIAEYIKNNPACWEQDCFYTGNEDL